MQYIVFRGFIFAAFGAPEAIGALDASPPSEFRA